MRYFFPRRVPTDRQSKRAVKALHDGRYVYMRKSSKEGYPLVYVSGLVMEEIPLAQGGGPNSTVKYLFHRMPTRQETRRYGVGD